MYKNTIKKHLQNFHQDQIGKGDIENTWKKFCKIKAISDNEDSSPNNEIIKKPRDRISSKKKLSSGEDIYMKNYPEKKKTRHHIKRPEDKEPILLKDESKSHMIKRKEPLVLRRKHPSNNSKELQGKERKTDSGMKGATNSTRKDSKEAANMIDRKSVV